MDLKAAAISVLVGIIVVSCGVGLYDYRAGIITFGVLAAAVGVWRLTQE